MKYIKVVLVSVLLFTSGLSAQVKLPKLISDGMVLQRDANVKIWGWAGSNEEVSIGFMDSTYSVTANEDGEWSILLPELEAGGPYTMDIKASNSITINDIMVGDVWVCSGQSNMELPMSRVRWVYENEDANVDYKDIRQFKVPQTYDFKAPHEDVSDGSWKKATPENILDFSAVAYFYAKELYNKYHVPIGIINSSLGGSPIESWISEESLKKFPNYYDETLKFRDDELIKQIESSDDARIQNWYDELTKKDEGYKESGKRWSDEDISTSDWDEMSIPNYWNDTKLGKVNGSVWFRRTFEVPADAAGKEALLILGRIVDGDSTFINGTYAGNVTYQYPPRRYNIPAGLLKEGENTIAVRVVSEIGTGGFVPDKDYVIIAGNETIDLTGTWKYRVGAVMDQLEGRTFIRWKPLGLYNAMIAPLLNYKIKGAVWYQGESNTGRPYEYSKLLPALINDWRKNWDIKDMPFIYAQLPNFMDAKEEPSESEWAVFRESQLKTLSVPNTGMAVTIDLGEWNDIHPLNKEDVGKRLALAAEKVAYGDDIVYSGPIYESMKVDGNKVILSFTNTGSGLTTKGNSELKGFAIAGVDEKFVWADAKIEGDNVIVWSDKVTNPAAVRYAWADNPDKANLYNEEGLPASPFRTDTFGSDK